MKRQLTYTIIGVFFMGLLTGLIAGTLTMQSLRNRQNDNKAISLSDEKDTDTSSSQEKAASISSQKSSKIQYSGQIDAELTLDELYDKYEGKRVQIENCVATPTRVTFKNGTRIMLDNRSPEPMEITLGDRKYRIYDYDSAIVTISSTSLPRVLQMDCQMGDEIGKNIAQILVQR